MKFEEDEDYKSNCGDGRYIFSFGLQNRIQGSIHTFTFNNRYSLNLGGTPIQMFGTYSSEQQLRNKAANLATRMDRLPLVRVPFHLLRHDGKYTALIRRTFTFGDLKLSEVAMCSDIAQRWRHHAYKVMKFCRHTSLYIDTKELTPLTEKAVSVLMNG